MWQRLLIVLGVIALAEYYSFIVVRSAARNLPGNWRIAVMILYITLSLSTWLGIMFFRQINWAGIPHLLRNIYIAFTLGFVVGKVLILLVMLIDELRRLSTWIYQYFRPHVETGLTTPQQGGTGIPRSVFLSRVALLLGAGMLTGFVYGITNRYNYQVRRTKIKFPSLPNAFKGLKIVHISDIHTGSFDNHEAVSQGIQKVLDEKPDIILFTGDLVNNMAHEVDAKYQAIFSRLTAPMGVYSVLGNHDYGDYIHWDSLEEKKKNLEDVKEVHAAMGWRLLVNEHVLLHKDEQSIALIGIENWGAKGNFSRYGDMQKAYAGLPEKNIPFQILMSHDPSHWDAQVRPLYPNVDLTLSGHTHGMQFGIEIPGIKWSPIKYMYPQWAGLYQKDKQYLYVLSLIHI